MKKTEREKKRTTKKWLKSKIKKTNNDKENVKNQDKEDEELNLDGEISYLVVTAVMR